MGTFVAAEMTTHLWAAGVTMPVRLVQVLKDAQPRNPENAQKSVGRRPTDKPLGRSRVCLGRLATPPGSHELRAEQTHPEGRHKESRPHQGLQPTGA